MKKDFLTGLALILPVALTIAIVFFLVNLITHPFINIVSSTFDHYDILNYPIWIFSADQVLMFSSKVFILLALIAIILFLGMFGRILFLHYFFELSEYIIHRIPIVNKVYKAAKDVVHTLLGKSDNRFSSVVLVPFPHLGTYSVGLVTSGGVSSESDQEYRGLVSVFVPGTPNPAMGFMLLFKPEQLKPLDMTVHQALKFVISCGVVIPPNIQTKV